MTAIPTRDQWFHGAIKNQLTDKDAIAGQLISQMINRTIGMFEYNGLPDTIPAKDLELILQVGGSATIAKDDQGDLYAFRAGLGGEPNPYYLPTVAVVANPALKLNKTYTIGQDSVVMLNDWLYQGIMPVCNRYAYMQAEAEVSLRYALLNSRMPALIQADNDNTHKSAEAYIAKIVEGQDYGIISSREFFDGIKTQDYAARQQPITEIIESIQYIKGSWLQDLGINAQYNMKRESIMSSEASLNDDLLRPTVDTMLECRRQGLEQVNRMFGTNITVNFSGVWELNERESEAELEVIESEVNDRDDLADLNDGTAVETAEA